MKLTLNSLLKIHSALSQLDFFVAPGKAATRGGKVDSQPTRVSYQFSGAFRYNRQKNLRLLGAENDTWLKAHDELVRQLSGGKDEIRLAENPDEALAKYQAQTKAMLDRQVDVPGLLMLPRAELFHDCNPVPLEIVEALDPILEGEVA